MKYAYPAIFKSEDNKILVDAPDLPGIHTFGDDICDALYMAKDAIEMWLWDAENKKEKIPPPSNLSDLSKKYMNFEQSEQFVSVVAADTDEYRRKNDSRSVKKTLTIPAWLNNEAEQANAPFSQILQQGLKSYLGINR